MVALYLILRVVVWCIEVSIKVTFWLVSWGIALIQMLVEYIIEQKELKNAANQTKVAEQEAGREETKPQAFYSNRR